jgi:hypothetical protein
MGETASPGNDVSAATDHIPNSAHIVMTPFPVLTCSIQNTFIQIANKSCWQKVERHGILASHKMIKKPHLRCGFFIMYANDYLLTSSFIKHYSVTG